MTMAYVKKLFFFIKYLSLTSLKMTFNRNKHFELLLKTDTKNDVI